MEKIIAVSSKTFKHLHEKIPSPGNDQVLVQTKSVGICGSDIHLYRGDHPYTKFPMVFGHEASGIVESVGKNIGTFKIGDPVVLEPLIPCGTCYPCSIGRTNCCSNMKTVGVTTDGALAEYFTVPASCLHKIPGEIPFDMAALAEPFSIGFHATSRGAVNADDTVLIIGAGTIGLTILAAAKNKGAKVMVTDIIDFRLDIAKKMGADSVINCATANLKAAALAWTDGAGPNVVFEAVGLPQTLESAVDIVSDAGRVVIVGVTKKKFSIHGVDVTKKELSIIGSRNNLGKFEDALKYVASHAEIAKNLISHTFTFSETETAFAIADNHPENTCKVMISM